MKISRKDLRNWKGKLDSLKSLELKNNENDQLSPENVYNVRRQGSEENIKMIKNNANFASINSKNLSCLSSENLLQHKNQGKFLNWITLELIIISIKLSYIEKSGSNEEKVDMETVFRSSKLSKAISPFNKIHIMADINKDLPLDLKAVVWYQNRQKEMLEEVNFEVEERIKNVTQKIKFQGNF